MNARNLFFAAGCGVLYLMVGALLWQQQRAPAPLTSAGITAAVESAVQPLRDDVASLQNRDATERETYVAESFKTLDARISALSEQIAQANLKTKTEMEAKTQAIQQMAQANNKDVEQILSGKRSRDVLGNVESDPTMVAAIQKSASVIGRLRVTNTDFREQRLRIGSIVHEVPARTLRVKTFEMVVPVGTIVEAVDGSGGPWPMPAGGLHLEFFDGRVHNLN